MKNRSRWCVVLCLWLLPAAVQATTLYLNAEVELLVLDGKRVSSSLLRGAEKVELDNGPHQLVFVIERSHLQHLPLVAIFDSQPGQEVRFDLSHMPASRVGSNNVDIDNLRLIGAHNQPIPFRLDILPIPVGQPGNYEVATRSYNQGNGKAASAQFINVTGNSDGTSANSADRSSLNEDEQQLRFWFNHADKPTRTRFLAWANQQPAAAPHDTGHGITK